MNHNWIFFTVTRTAGIYGQPLCQICSGWNTTPEDLQIGSVWLATQSFKHQTFIKHIHHIHIHRTSNPGTLCNGTRSLPRCYKRTSRTWRLPTSLLHWPLGSIGIHWGPKMSKDVWKLLETVRNTLCFTLFHSVHLFSFVHVLGLLRFFFASRRSAL